MGQSEEIEAKTIQKCCDLNGMRWACYCLTSFDFKNLSSAPKSFRAFLETGPRPGTFPEHYLRTPGHTQEHPQRAGFPLENPDPLLQKMGKKLHNQQN